jgi:hypothetical protein
VPDRVDLWKAPVDGEKSEELETFPAFDFGEIVTKKSAEFPAGAKLAAL